MLIEDYIKQVKANAQLPSPPVLFISPTLAQSFSGIWRRSERDVLERGCNLFFRHGRLECQQEIIGLRTTVVLNVGGVTKDPSYIGDFHVHPYLRKMGRDAKIGPSLDDILGWLKDRPTAFSMSVNFVAACDAIFLIVIRGVTLKMPTQGLPPHIVDQEPVRGMQNYFDDINAYSKWSKGMSDVQSALDRSNEEATKVERKLWNSIFDFANVFTALNHRYNVMVANYLNYEYYVWDRSSHHYAAGFCRASKAVY